jgi:hypothetical protein
MANAVDAIANELIRRGAERAKTIIIEQLGLNGHTEDVLNLLFGGLAQPHDVAQRIAIPPQLAKATRQKHEEPKPKPVKYLKRVALGPLKEKLLAHIMLHPGQRSEEILPHVRPENVKPDAMLRALGQLADEGWVTTVGVARGTKYTAATKPPQKVPIGSSKNLAKILTTKIRKGK